LGAFLRRY